MAPVSFYDKKILTEGLGSLPGEGSECEIEVLDVQEDGLILTSLWIKKKEHYNITIGEADTSIDYGVEYAVRNMKKGEVSEISLGIETFSSKLTIKLLGFSASIPFFQLNDSQKFERARRHKENGNDLFKSSKIKEAFHRFSKSIKYIVSLRQNNTASEEINDLYSNLCNNMALCQLLTGNFEFSVDLCNKVLSVSQFNVKALLRRADALIELKKFDRAASDLKKIIEMEPANNRALTKLAFVNNELKNQEETYKNMVKRMFTAT